MERLIGAVLPAFFSSIPVGFERTHVTVEPRFNEVQRDRGNYCNFGRAEENRSLYRELRYIEVR